MFLSQDLSDKWHRQNSLTKSSSYSQATDVDAGNNGLVTYRLEGGTEGL